MLYSSRKNIQAALTYLYILRIERFLTDERLVIVDLVLESLTIGFVFVKSFSHCLRYFLNSAFLGEKFPDSDFFSSPAHTEAKNRTIAAGHSNLNMINI